MFNFVSVKLNIMEQVRLIRVGSASDNDVVINHEAINAYHLELFQDARGNVFLSDLKTDLGTFVNGQKVKAFCALSIKDKVTIAGKFMFDWTKLVTSVDVSKKIATLRSNLVYSENLENMVDLPELVSVEEEYLFDEELPEDATFIQRWNYFYTHNSSIVHIFVLNIVLFILLYIAFLS
jgi:pSer/pThr/pTyr-binding forkhead associated (FHA) protein